MRVFRHQLPISDQPTTLLIGEDGQLLYVAMKPGESDISLWELDTGGPKVEREFFVVGTGHNFECEAGGRYAGPKYHGSVIHQLAGGVLVWHVFEGRRVPRRP